MESSFGRSRIILYALPLILVTIMSTSVGAQGLFGTGFPGASYLNGFWSGAVLGCGTPGWPGAGPTVYVGGSADYANGTSYGLVTQGLTLGGLASSQNSYSNRGIWLGLALPIDLGPRFGVTGSAWTLLRTGLSTHLRDSVSPRGNGMWTPGGHLWRALQY